MGEKLRFVSALTLLLAACGPADRGPAEESVSSRGYAGLSSQGQQLQGSALQGNGLWGMQFQGVQLRSLPLQNVQLQGTALVAQVAQGARTVSGMDFIGATLNGLDTSGTVAQYLISDIQTDLGDASGETLLYTLLYYDAASASWQNACLPDASGAQLAIPVAGVWDQSGGHSDSSDYFTFGCTSAVIAKCVRWGYKPWQSLGGRSLADFHQACTRMARADYCGDGVTHTQNGTMIDMYDVLGIQTKDANDGMVFEAAWTPDGAYCVSKARWNLISATLLLECPNKLSLPGLSDILNPDSCVMKLSPGDRSSALISNRSYLLQLAL